MLLFGMISTQGYEYLRAGLVFLFSQHSQSLEGKERLINCTESSVWRVMHECLISIARIPLSNGGEAAPVHESIIGWFILTGLNSPKYTALRKVDCVKTRSPRSGEADWKQTKSRKRFNLSIYII